MKNVSHVEPFAIFNIQRQFKYVYFHTDISRSLFRLIQIYRRTICTVIHCLPSNLLGIVSKVFNALSCTTSTYFYVTMVHYTRGLPIIFPEDFAITGWVMGQTM
jgi:hypothetical protein